MFVSEAWAQGAVGGGGDLFSMMFPLLLIFGVFYFLLIRPQQKKAKEHREMLNQVRRGDKVITAGGIISTITKVINDDEVQVEIADGVKVKIARATLASVQSKTEPVKESAKKPEVANDEGEKKGGGLLGRLTNKD